MPAIEEPTLAPTRQADPSQPSLLEGLDAVFGSDTTPVTPVTPEPVKAAEPKAEPTPQPKAETKAKAEPKAAVELPTLIEEGFSKPDAIEEPVKDPTVFDEAEFDKQTEEQTKSLGDKPGEAFKALRAELKAAKQAAPPAELLKRVEEAEMKAKEAEGLRERLKTASAASAKLEVENDDTYIKEVKAPYNAIMGRLDKLSEVYEMDPSILRAIVREEDIKVQDEMIKTHLADFTEVRRQEVFSAIPRVGELLDKHEAAMASAEADFGAREAKRIQDTEKLLQEQKKAVQTITQDKWKRWEAVIPGLLDDDNQPTAEYEKLRNESLSIDFSQSRASDQAYAAFAGTLLPFAQQQIAVLQARLAEYEKSDKRALKGAPKPGDSLAVTPPVADGKPRSFMDGFMEQNFSPG
jgi:hypothetical protein